jgi:hypothetical protein
MKTNLFKYYAPNKHINIFDICEYDRKNGQIQYIEFVLKKLEYSKNALKKFNDIQEQKSTDIWKIVSSRRSLETIMRNDYKKFISIENFNGFIKTCSFKIPFMFIYEIDSNSVDEINKIHINRVAIFEYDGKNFKLKKTYISSYKNTDSERYVKNLLSDEWKDDTDDNIIDGKIKPMCLVIDDFLFRIIKINELNCIPVIINIYSIKKISLNSTRIKMLKKYDGCNEWYVFNDECTKWDTDCDININKNKNKYERNHTPSTPTNNIITVKHFYDNESLNKASNEINKLMLLSLLLPILLGVVVDADNTIIMFMEDYYSNEIMEIIIIAILNFIVLDKFIVKVDTIIKNIKSLLSSCGIPRKKNIYFIMYMPQTLCYTGIFQFYNLVTKNNNDSKYILTIIPQILALIINWVVLILLFVNISLIHLSVVVVKLMLLFVKNALTFLMYLDCDYLDNFDTLVKKSISVNYLETYLYNSLDTNKLQ